MPIPQVPAIPVGALAYPVSQSILGVPGPYKSSGGNFFIIVTEQRQVALNTFQSFIVAYKSTDGGQTYPTRIPSNSRVFLNNTACVFYPGSGDSVYIGYTDEAAGGFLSFVIFDMGAGSFGTPNSSTVTPTSTGDIGTLWCVNSGSNVLLAWDDGVGPLNINALYWNGASWSTKTVVASGNFFIMPVTLASGGKAALRYADSGIAGQGGVGSVHYVVLTGATITSDSVEFTVSGNLRLLFFGGQDREQFSGYYDAATDSSVMPVAMYFSDTFLQFHRLFIASPSAAPVFSKVTAVNFNDTEFTGYPFLTGNLAGTAFSLYWQSAPSGNVSSLIQYATAPSLTGPWSGAALYYDVVANPPAPPSLLTSSEMFPMWANTLPSGEVALIIGLDQANVDVPYNLADIFTFALGASLSLACPVVSTGAVGAPFSAILIVTGGTPPYTFVLTGGSLPLGLSLNQATGVISGTPVVAGTYSYTVTVTDSSTPEATALVTCQITIAPVASSGGRGFIKFTLNFFNACLGREYLLYKLINRELLKCGIKPACFCIDERDWGGNFSEHEEVPMGPPEGAIAFNPTGQIPLPTIASGDNTILQFRVPIGYDGVILGQYHQYITDPTAFPPPIFVEGSGDIVWRLECAGRFMRDCGEMEVSIGSLQNMSPIAGGLQVRSNDLIRYVVAAPNTSGNLTAGVGNIVAGLHGWWWPRK